MRHEHFSSLKAVYSLLPVRKASSGPHDHIANTCTSLIMQSSRNPQACVCRRKHRGCANNASHCHRAAEATDLKGSSAASATSSGLIMRSAGMSTCKISAEDQI